MMKVSFYLDWISIIFIFVLFKTISEQSILTDSDITFYTTEGSTINLTLNISEQGTYFGFKGYGYNKHGGRVNTNKYDIVERPNVLEFQIINITASDKGFYWFDNWSPTYELELKITSMAIITYIYFYLIGYIGVNLLIMNGK